jgi:uncharacterized membrane protein
MGASLAILLLWLLFAGTHVALSSLRLRPRLVERLGERGFQGVFSLLAVATLAPLVYAYFTHKHAGPLLWSIPLAPGLRWLLYLGMGVAVVLMVAGLVTPSPAALGAPESAAEPRGVQLLTRHALFMGLGLLGLLHLVPNGFLADAVFFAGFPAFALLGCWHQDRRKLVTAGERFRRFHARTPFLPFTGGETLRGLRELSRPALVGGVGATVLLRVLHPALFGP